MGNGNYLVNIFIRSPTRNIREWRRWVTDLRSRRYRTFANGTGRVRYIAQCGGCHSVSHPPHLCPYPRLLGWNGPEQGEGVFGERRRADERARSLRRGFGDEQRGARSGGDRGRGRGRPGADRRSPRGRGNGGGGSGNGSNNSGNGRGHGWPRKRGDGTGRKRY